MEDTVSLFVFWLDWELTFARGSRMNSCCYEHLDLIEEYNAGIAIDWRVEAELRRSLIDLSEEESV